MRADLAPAVELVAVDIVDAERTIVGEVLLKNRFVANNGWRKKIVERMMGRTKQMINSLMVGADC